VVQVLENTLYAVFNLPEINTDADFVEFVAPHKDVNNPVVPMNTGTVPRDILLKRVQRKSVFARIFQKSRTSSLQNVTVLDCKGLSQFLCPFLLAATTRAAAFPFDSASPVIKAFITDRNSRERDSYSAIS